MHRQIKSLYQAHRQNILFCTWFCLYICLFATLFYLNRDFFGTLYIYPMVYLASALLHLFAIENQVITTNLANGFCDLELNNVIYRVKHECTGLFANSIFLSAVLAYPKKPKQKIFGLLMGISAFFVFGLLRIIIMAVVALTSPEHIPFFHVYVMVIVSLGFAITLWIFWLD